MVDYETPLTEQELSGFEYHGLSSGTSTQPMVRDCIVKACQEIRQHREGCASALREAERKLLERQSALNKIADMLGVVHEDPKIVMAVRNVHEALHRRLADEMVAPANTEALGLRAENARLQRELAVVRRIATNSGWSDEDIDAAIARRRHEVSG